MSHFPVAPSRRSRASWVWALLLLAPAVTADPGAQGVRLYYRVVGSQNNAPLLPKTRSAWHQRGQERTANTGMADEGYTEFPHCQGVMDFTFIEDHAFYPRLVSGAVAAPGRINTADLVVDHVYEPDGCVWGPAGREFIQTFTATRAELVSITLLVATAPGRFYVALHEGGPGGRQIGPAHSLRSGHSMRWGTARWPAGQAPLVPGRTYALRFWRADGQPWQPYLHSMGDAYAGGQAYRDGRACPDTDLAVWIVEEPEDLRRSIILQADSEGWAYRTNEVWFTARARNVRLVWVQAVPVKFAPPTRHHCADFVLMIRDAQGRALGAAKRVLACGPKDGPHSGAVLFGPEEIPTVPGRRYALTVAAVRPKASAPDPAQPSPTALDLRVRVYGEPRPGALPAIYNLRVTQPAENRLRLDWAVTQDCPVRLAITGDGLAGAIPGLKRLEEDLPAGVNFREFKVWPGHTYEFSLTSQGAEGLIWRTPRYQVRMPRAKEITALVHSPPPVPESLIHLAPQKIASGHPPRPIRYQRQVVLSNSDFETGLESWHVSSESGKPDSGIELKVFANDAHPEGGTKWGKRRAGFVHQAGPRREQVFATATLSRQIKTVPGHVYRLTVMAYTDVKGGPRGDIRIRLAADPEGKKRLGMSAGHSSQWYWTDRQWRRLRYEWRAQTTEATIGLGFFRWQDVDRAQAFVDEVRVYDLGPAPLQAGDPDPASETGRALALVDSKMEAEDRVEAYLAAPPGFVITGLGARAQYDNLTTLWLRIQPLLPDGTLGPAEQMRAGWEPDSHLEAQVLLPPGYVATGFGAGIAPEWDVKRLGVWARPLLPDGRLGEEQLFRGGVDRKSGFEKTVRLPKGRVLTDAGLNCMLNDVNGIKARSAELRPTARGVFSD